MSDDQTAGAARPAKRPITADEYFRLAEIGVLGEKVELIEGEIVFGRYPFVFSAEAIAAAHADDIDI